MKQNGASEFTLRRFRECGTHAHVVQSVENPGVYRIAYHHCHSRWCLPCGNARSRVIAGNLGTWLQGKTARFLTLTLRADDSPLADKIALLDKAWTALKRSDLWQRTQTGGVAFLEVKIGENSGLWHPHLHIMTAGKYIDQGLVKDLWCEFTGGSDIVHIEAVRVPARAVSYAAKYASKPLDPSVFSRTELLREAMFALHGVRTVRTFGDCKGLQMTAALDPQAWEYVAPLTELVKRATDGDDRAMAILEAVLPDDLAYLLTEGRTAHPPRPPLPINSVRQLEFPLSDPIAPRT
jgi:hypothetical protein